MSAAHFSLEIRVDLGLCCVVLLCLVHVRSMEYLNNRHIRTSYLFIVVRLSPLQRVRMCYQNGKLIME